MIPRETIRNILEATVIEDVVGDFITLKKQGSNYWGLCPFHDEKTPSFSVSASKGIYKCFGCGKAGSAVNFVMEHEHYTYPEALRYLAKKYNIEIEEEERTPEQVQKEHEEESLYNINQFAQQFFTKSLLETEQGKALALSYLGEREFKKNAIEKFQLGYSPEGWDEFKKFAEESGYVASSLVKAGLVIEKDGKYFDRFRGRVIFPIHNLTGRVVGFGGRILTSDKKAAKYINSPETDI
ncbi:MAG: DNA primase, partial [Bacteroidales bacterium]|nr:DNA primase [Bacteroidales bacterium]